MLTKFLSHETNFHVWTSFIESVLTLIATDGTRCWKLVSAIAEFKPSSRRNESIEDYENSLRAACWSPGSCRFEFDLTVSSDSGLLIVIKECEILSTTKTLLFRMVAPACDFMLAFTQILEQSEEMLMANQTEICQLKTENDEREKTIVTLSGELGRTAVFKDELQNNLLKKVVLLLNSKKREIHRLRSLQEDVYVPPPVAVELPVVKPRSRKTAEKKTPAPDSFSMLKSSGIELAGDKISDFLSQSTSVQPSQRVDDVLSDCERSAHRVRRTKRNLTAVVKAPPESPPELIASDSHSDRDLSRIEEFKGMRNEQSKKKKKRLQDLIDSDSSADEFSSYLG